MVTVIPAEHKAANTTLEANRLMAAFGWTEDQFRMLFQPLVEYGQEPLWSMGDDAPPAFLSSLPRPVWDYCKQRFAQVTNPPIDPLRESHVMSLDVYLGKNTKLNSPLLDRGQMHSVVETMSPIHGIDFSFDLTLRVPFGEGQLIFLLTFPHLFLLLFYKFCWNFDQGNLERIAKVAKVRT